MHNWCEYRKYKCWLYFGINILNRKIGVNPESKTIASRAGWRLLDCTQKVQMVKCTPRRPLN